MPLDNFVLYNGGYKVLNGYVPFNDYWLVTGPLLDYLNAFYFKIFGVNWSAYTSHSATFNSIITILTYIFLISIGLKKEWSFIYSLFFAFLMYPVVGTPFVDHHSTIFLLIGYYLFIISIVSKRYNILYFIPLIMVLGFFSKQTPVAYGIFGIIFSVCLLFFIDKKECFQLFRYLIFGSAGAIIFIFIFFAITKINFQNFYTQYILFSQTIGKFRLSQYQFEFFSIISQFKFIVFYLIFISYFLYKSVIKNQKKDYVVLSIVLLLSLILIFHQLITLNQEFIFFLIPLLAGITHKYLIKIKINSNYLFILSIIICFIGTAKYHYRFNELRKFNELEKVNLNLSQDANQIHKSLDGLKWITYLNPNDPVFEINQLKKALDLISNNSKNKMLITQYQFIGPALKIFDNSPNQWHHATVSFPIKGQKYFDEYKNYFVDKIIKRKIDGIYVIGKEDENTPQLVLDRDCLNKEITDEIIFYYSINKKCKDFK